MKISYETSFSRDLKKIVSKMIRAEIKQVVCAVKDAATKRDILDLKKLKGYRINYRIKVGEYRIGVTILGDTVTFVRCFPRKDFYKHFPPK